jgi:putative spermidine/putrescine transport system substrate-binding protein
MKFRWLAVAAGTALVVSACGSSSSSGGELKSIGKGEGQLDIIAWAGYAESGKTDPKYDWVTPFEKESGCKTNVKTGASSDDMVTLMKSGSYDGVSASGDASLRLIVGGDVAPVNTALLTNYNDVADFLKNTSYNSYKGKAYGQPHGWGANVLQYNTDIVKPAPTSWAAVFDANSPYKGKITAYDSPIYIADAALYLSKAKPELGIKNPYALKQAQFDAAVALLKQQKPLLQGYWGDYTKYVSDAEAGSIVLGTSWQVITNLLQADKKVNVANTLPTEGATAWSDTWMVAKNAKHPNCMYLWMNWISKPDVQSQVSQYFGEAPANLKSCDLSADMKTQCDGFHANDKAYYSSLSYWVTPTKECLDGSGSDCVAYTDWQKAWTEIKG